MTPLTDDKLEQFIGNLLRAGVMLSAAIVLVAGIAFLVQHHADPVGYTKFQVERNDLRTLGAIMAAAIRFRPDAIIQLGLVLLIATPIARVALAVLGFGLQRDYLYVGVSLIVLSILLFGIFHAT
jgi:uncharacterized membrane protein